jgi:hypothetical protein
MSNIPLFNSGVEHCSCPPTASPVASLYRERAILPTSNRALPREVRKHAKPFQPKVDYGLSLAGCRVPPALIRKYEMP